VPSSEVLDQKNIDQSLRQERAAAKCFDYILYHQMPREKERGIILCDFGSQLNKNDPGNDAARDQLGTNYPVFPPI